MTLRCIIVDDEPMARALLKDYCQKVEFLQVEKEFTNAIAAGSYLAQHSIDLIFLDIKMPELSGLSFLRTLRNPPKVIFTTAFAEYAVDGFELDAIDYLLKPFDFARFFKAVNKAHAQHSQEDLPTEEPSHLLVKEGREWIKLLIDNIVYIKGQKDYVMFYTSTRKIMSLMNMKDIEKELSARGFLRIHQSYIVNTKAISSLSTDKVLLQNERLPVSASYKQQVKLFIEQNKSILATNKLR